MRVARRLRRSRRTPRFTSCACRRTRRCPDWPRRWPKADGRCARRPTASARSSGWQGTTWDSFLATIGPAHRATTRRRLRSLERNFTMRFEQIADDAMRQYALAKLFDFHRARFGRRGTAFHTKALRDFHLDVTERLQRAGMLRLFMLHLNDALVGVMYGMSFKGRFYFYQHGYDPQFQSHGVGRAVLDMSIRAAIDGRARRVRSALRRRSLQICLDEREAAARALRRLSGRSRRPRPAASASKPNVPCAPSRAASYPPMPRRRADRWRWHLRVALASAIAGACRLEQHARKAREQRRPLILGYHRVVSDFAAASQTEMPSMLISQAMFERHVECDRQELPLRLARRDRRARVERRAVRRAGRRHYVRRRLSRRV